MQPGPLTCDLQGLEGASFTLMFDRQSQDSLPLKMKKYSSSFEDTRPPEQTLVDGLKVDAGRELSLNLSQLLNSSAKGAGLAESERTSPLSSSAVCSTTGRSRGCSGEDLVCRI